MNRLGRRCGVCGRAAPYSSVENEEPPLAIDGSALPLAAKRLTGVRPGLCGPPLVAGERCFSGLLNVLEALP